MKITNMPATLHRKSIKNCRRTQKSTAVVSVSVCPLETRNRRSIHSNPSPKVTLVRKTSRPAVQIGRSKLSIPMNFRIRMRRQQTIVRNYGKRKIFKSKAPMRVLCQNWSYPLLAWIIAAGSKACSRHHWTRWASCSRSGAARSCCSRQHPPSPRCISTCRRSQASN